MVCPLIRTPRLPAVDWTDTPADLNRLVHFSERPNLVSSRVLSRFKRALLITIHILPHSKHAEYPLKIKPNYKVFCDVTLCRCVFYDFSKDGSALIHRVERSKTSRCMWIWRVLCRRGRWWWKVKQPLLAYQLLCPFFSLVTHTHTKHALLSRSYFCDNAWTYRRKQCNPSKGVKHQVK